MSKKRKNKKESKIDDSWLLPYADILTLLLALFIVLYSMSSVDAQKFQELSEAFNSVFVGKKSIIDNEQIMPNDPDEIREKVEDSERIDDKDQKKDDQDEKEVDESHLNAAGKQEVEALTDVQERIDDYIIQNSFEERFETSLTKQGLLITIRDHVLFDSGSAHVKKKEQKLAKELSELLLMEEKREIVISGHTDNVPIHTANFASNWELSVTRAVNFMKLILENDKHDPRYFSAKGSGEYEPIATNDTAEGRSKNRRVEILVTPLINLSTEEVED